jgi:hypothetical protein
MRQHLDTAPVLEKMRDCCECPLCALKKENEASYVEYFLGGSVMEVSTRLTVNEKGFCGRHLRLLFDANNRLGLALLQASHLKERLKELKSRPEAPRGRLKGKALSPPRALFKRKKAPPPSEESCALCERLDATMRRYALTVAALWEKEHDFKALLEASKGFCLPHYEMIRAEAPGALSGQALSAFYEVLDRVEAANLERIVCEVDWFCEKHDYRNADKPWGESRDAVERCMKKLRGE